MLNNVKKISAILLSLIIVVAFTSCGQKKSEDKKNTKKASNKITFCLDWTPNTNHTGLYVALDKGYFKDAGLDVDVVQPPDNGSASLVGAGKAQFGIDAQDTMAPALTGKNKLPITAVSAILQHNTSGIISLKSKGIDSPSKLQGHSYATWDNPVEKATLKQLVNDDGGDFSKVELIPSTVTDEVSAFKKDSVDSIWIFYGWAGIACKQAGLDCNYLNFSKLNDTFDYYTPVVIANNSYLKNDPDQARAFLKALSKGYDYAAKHPDEAADILIKANPELEDSSKLVHESQNYLSKLYIDDAKRWGEFDEARWNRYYKWLNDNKLVHKKLEKNVGFTNDYLPK